MNQEIGIPRKLSHVWIGHLPRPVEWMRTWEEHHPTWEYRVFGNDFLREHRFVNQHLIREYIRRAAFEGVADLMRYEILYEQGGLMPGADAICLRPMDGLFDHGGAFTVYENEFSRGELVSPILACEPKNEFVGHLIERLNSLQPGDLQQPWRSTGNLFVARMIAEARPRITIWPSHYLIPEHKDGLTYSGSGPVYARQMWGTTRALYGRPSTRSGPTRRVVRRVIARARRQAFVRATLNAPNFRAVAHDARG